MSKKKNISILVIILVVIFILYAGARSRMDKESDPGSMQTETMPYAETGPFHVGTDSLKLNDDQVMEIQIWYPAVGEDLTQQKLSYPYQMKMGKPIGAVTIASFAGHAAKQAAFNLSDGPYPLVILSPGFSIGSNAYAWLAEHLASYGFVVISPDHVETLDPADQLWRSAISRPQDVMAVFAFADQEIKPGGIFEGLIDSQTVAVVGHSYGGYTALAAAGAQFDTKSFRSLCENAIQDDEPGAWLCEMLLPKITDMASFAGLDSVPEGLWPAQADPRVDAIIPMAGDAFFFGDVGLSKITIPVLSIGGTADQDSPFEWGTQPSYQYTAGPRKALLALIDAEHMIFTGPCERIPWYMKFFSGEFCADSNWNRIYAQMLTKHFSTAFLLAELKGDSEALIFLAPEEVMFEGVRFEADGY